MDLCHGEKNPTGLGKKILKEKDKPTFLFVRVLGRRIGERGR